LDRIPGVLRIRRWCESRTLLEGLRTPLTAPWAPNECRFGISILDPSNRPKRQPKFSCGTVRELFEICEPVCQMHCRDLREPTDEYRVPNTATTAPPPAPTEYTTASNDLIGGATKFLMAWFVKQDLDEASRYLPAKCGECLMLNRASEQSEPKTTAAAQAELKKAMQSILDTTGMVKALEEAIVAPSPNHEDIKLVKHARSKAFVLASIPDYMGAALDCARRTPRENR
jgi:hypothetical protein